MTKFNHKKARSRLGTAIISVIIAGLITALMIAAMLVHPAAGLAAMILVGLTCIYIHGGTE